MTNPASAKTSPVPSSGPLHDYISTCLATSGMCVLHRPFIEQVAPHALVGAGDSFDPAVWPGATRWSASIKGSNATVLVLARSDRDLGLRVEQRLGVKVESIELAPDPGATERMNASLAANSEAVRQKRLQKLRRAAEQDLSAETEGSPRWREIVQARKDLGWESNDPSS